MTPGGALPDSIAMLMGMARLYEEGHSGPTKRSVMDMEHARMRELSLAFASGCAFIGAIAFAAQRFSRSQVPSSPLIALE
jgi:hypothetical protein